MQLCRSVCAYLRMSACAYARMCACACAGMCICAHVRIMLVNVQVVRTDTTHAVPTHRLLGGFCRPLQHRAHLHKCDHICPNRIRGDRVGVTTREALVSEMSRAVVLQQLHPMRDTHMDTTRRDTSEKQCTHLQRVSASPRLGGSQLGKLCLHRPQSTLCPLVRLQPLGEGLLQADIEVPDAPSLHSVTHKRESIGPTCNQYTLRTHRHMIISSPYVVIQHQRDTNRTVRVLHRLAAFICVVAPRQGIINHHRRSRSSPSGTRPHPSTYAMDHST
jgi:hypothetical protein